jgi:hypothetical protein
MKKIIASITSAWGELSPTGQKIAIGVAAAAAFLLLFVIIVAARG